MPTRYESTTRALLRSDADIVLDEWGESVVRRIGGSFQNTVEITAIVDLDDETGGGMDGDGQDPSTPNGQRVRRSGILDVKHSTDLFDNDTIEHDGLVWAVKRIVARDDGMKSYAMTAIEGLSSKRARVRP